MHSLPFTTFDILRTAIAIPFLLIFIKTAIENFKNYKTHNAHEIIPFIGGVCGTIGVLITPIAITASLLGLQNHPNIALLVGAIIPLILDFGCIPIITIAIIEKDE